MKKIWIVLLSILALIVMTAFVFGGKTLNLAFQRHFRPQEVEIERKVFNESYIKVNGLNKDLAKYYEKYMLSDNSFDKQIIAEIVKERMVELKTENVPSDKIRKWLVEIRGY